MGLVDKMQRLVIDERVKNKFPNLSVLTDLVTGVNVEKKSDELEEFKETVYEEVRKEHDLKNLKDERTFRAYRDFFWKIDIDPTKIRPASEALVRRVLQGNELPTINTLVDAYNLASLKSGIPLAAFDSKNLNGKLKIRLGERGEKFLGIGMEKPMELKGGEIVVSDEEKLIAIYPYRDSSETKITTRTQEVLLMVCGAPEVGDRMEKAEEIMLEYVKRFCDGEKKHG